MAYFTAKRNRELAPPRPQDGQRGPWVVEVLLLLLFPRSSSFVIERGSKLLTNRKQTLLLE